MSATVRLAIGAAADVEEVTLDLRLPISVDALVAITHALGKLDPNAVIRTDGEDGIAPLVLRLDRRKIRRAARRRSEASS